ncbi:MULTISPECIES: hypothetical protein [Acidiplasma]|uniref:Uncharacterized protein n=1 Tax=Acidiplasma aeolicum TaxID=507754 RepID=A0A0Q0RUK3_9ARCH|nr:MULTISPECIES: hypothetical protein [Acidiplasma]KPV47197.1 hypothetical protein SE19_02080 [Acidiplasma aeolicum]KQB35997.1 hypothetical protein AOG54_02465 [Acidiplasma aeolicum]
MKGSIYRKRYILAYSENGDELDKYLFYSMGIKRKYRYKNYRIYLANQFNRNNVIKKIEYHGGRVEYVSGTLKKCKKILGSEIIKTLN